MTAPVGRDPASIMIVYTREGLLKFSVDVQLKNLIGEPILETGPKELFDGSLCPRIIFHLKLFSCRDVRYLMDGKIRMIRSESTHYEVVACIAHSIFEALNATLSDLSAFSFQGRCHLDAPCPFYTISSDGVSFQECPDRRGPITHSYAYFGSNKLCLFLNEEIDSSNIMNIIRRKIF